MMRIKRWLQCLGVVSSKWCYYHPLLRKPGKCSLSRGVIYTNQRAYSEISAGGSSIVWASRCDPHGGGEQSVQEAAGPGRVREQADSRWPVTQCTGQGQQTESPEPKPAPWAMLG